MDDDATRVDLPDAWSTMVCALHAAEPRDVGILESTARLRRLGGRLQADTDFEVRWLGIALVRWLHAGGDLLALLGVKPGRGSHVTPQLVVLRDRQDDALLRLAAAAGTDARALALLRGAKCPTQCAELLHEALALDVPRSRAAISRARARRCVPRHRS